MKVNKISIISATIIVLSAVSCSKNEKTAVVVEEQLPVVTIDVAHQLDVPQMKSFAATVEAENVNNISPAQPNRIKTINVDAGDRVSVGQVLVTLDAAASDQLRINLEQIEREYKRACQLLEIGGGTQQAVDQLKAQLDAAKSQYDNMMENTVLRSPINGLVTARNYDPGDMTGSLPVLTVGQLSPVVKVMINVNESDLSKIHQGMDVEVEFDAYPGENYNGKIRRIYPAVDASTRTSEIEVSIANPNEKIKPGMFARVSTKLGEQSNVVVPDRAVVKQTGSGNKYVYVYSNGKVNFNKVELGQRLDNAYELLSGINDGDTVVITGQTRLADGAQVEILNR